MERINRGVCANNRPKTGPQGPLFSQWRLKQAQFAAEHFRDPREIDAVVMIYTVGYNMGFAHGWESVDQESHVEKVTADWCERIVQSQDKLSAEQAAAASAKCREAGRRAREEHGPELKCMLVAKGQMNSDLSGLENKQGCTR